MGLMSLEPLIYKMGGELHLLEAMQLEVNGKLRTFVSNIARMQMCG